MNETTPGSQPHEPARRKGHPFRSTAVAEYERPLALSSPNLAPNRPGMLLAAACLIALLGIAAQILRWP